MGLRLAQRWIWDFWHTYHAGRHHLFYLQAPRSLASPDERHWNVSIGHAVSPDLRTWEVLPDALAPSRDGWDDCTTWTGSVLRHEGRWWMFYTGTSHDEGGLVQRVGLATSEDLAHWERYGDAPLIELDPRWYEVLDLDVWHDQAWRDPWVFRDDDGTFHALITARANHGEPAGRGVVAHASSPDLLRWEVHPPVVEPGRFGHLEIPQLVRGSDRWWLLFATPPAAPDVVERFPSMGVEGTHVLSGPAPLGPFAWDTHHLLDGDSRATRYGGRLVAVPGDPPDRWRLLVWLNHDSGGRFVGELADPVPVETHDGRLRLRP